MAIPKTIRQQVFNKYGGKCAYCGCELQKGWHVDHLEPIYRKKKRVTGHWSDGWHQGMGEQEMFDKNIQWIPEKWADDGCEQPQRDHVDNMIPSCASCNIQKHGNDLEFFRKEIAQFINSLNQYHSIYRFAKRYGLVEETGKPVKFYFETIAETKQPIITI